MTNNSPLLLHIPHASIFIPPEELPRFCPVDLAGELLKMTDRYCDELFTGYEKVAFPVSRLVCDPERFRDDAQETMSRIGMGAIYTKTSSGDPLRWVTEEEREKLLRQYYDPHHARLTEAVEEKLKVHGRCLIIDDHSFHPIPLPYEPDQEPDRPDFCIGTDPYHTPEKLAIAAMTFLQREGFTVSLNRPYAGSLVPLKYYRRDGRVCSIMIEINRRLYMDENGRRSERFSSIQRTVSVLLEKLEEYSAANE
ncbi:MAG: N-formylglutamate amidohydrolase [Clostridia bacterium]|nr:N-formylglutamate amidohydrolase [Clostridia bacterium]